MYYYAIILNSSLKSRRNFKNTFLNYYLIIIYIYCIYVSIELLLKSYI